MGTRRRLTLPRASHPQFILTSILGNVEPGPERPWLNQSPHGLPLRFGRESRARTLLGLSQATHACAFPDAERCRMQSAECRSSMLLLRLSRFSSLLVRESKSKLTLHIAEPLIHQTAWLFIKMYRSISSTNNLSSPSSSPPPIPTASRPPMSGN